MESLKIPNIRISIVILLAVSLGGYGCEQKKLNKENKTVLFMDNYRGPTVTVSGQVLSPGYETGAIKIFASRKHCGPAGIAVTRIPHSGEYSLKVPKDFGDVYIVATIRRLKSGESPKGNKRRPYGRFLKIGSFDIKSIDLDMNTRPFPLMDFYLGPTVTISGKVIFPDYKSGPIVISISGKTQNLANINLRVLPAPGEFSLKAPKNFGDLNLQATNPNPDEKTALNKNGKYRQNHLRVSHYDIRGIDIVF